MLGWIRAADESKTDWLEPTKSLSQLEKERQELSDAPKIEPMPLPPPPPPEIIPYKEMRPLLEASVKAILDSTLGLHKAELALAKIMAIVPATGDKGRDITTKIEGFKQSISGLYHKSEEVSKEIASYKNTVPEESNLES